MKEAEERAEDKGEEELTALSMPASLAGRYGCLQECSD